METVAGSVRQVRMAGSVSEPYDALVEAGAPKDQARRAAESVISRHEAEQQLTTKAELGSTTAALRSEIAGLRSDMLTMKAEIIKWNVGSMLVAVGLAAAIVKLICA